MATDNSRLFAPGVRVTECRHTDDYFGTAEALISAGLVRADQFPGQPGMPKSCATFYDGQRIGRGYARGKQDERYLSVRTVGKKFSVFHGVSQEVKDERRAVMEAEWDSERETERVAAVAEVAKREAERTIRMDRAKAEVVLYYMVNSADEYRKKMVKELRSRVRDVCCGDVLPNRNHGFSMDESVATELNDLLEEMIELISNADVRFNARRHKEINLKCKCDIAKADSRFQRTLEHLQQSAPESTIGEEA